MSAVILNLTASIQIKKLNAIMDKIEKNRNEIMSLWESLTYKQQAVPEIHMPIRTMLLKLLVESRKLDREIAALRAKV